MASGGGWRVTKTASRTPLLHYSRWRTRCQMPRNKMGGLPALRGGRAAPAIVFRHHTGHAQRVVSSLGVFKVLNPTWLPAAQQCAGQGPDRVCHGRVSTRRVLRPATKIGMRLPTAPGGETRSLSRTCTGGARCTYSYSVAVCVWQCKGH